MSTLRNTIYGSIKLFVIAWENDDRLDGLSLHKQFHGQFTSYNCKEMSIIQNLEPSRPVSTSHVITFSIWSWYLSFASNYLILHYFKVESTAAENCLTLLCTSWAIVYWSIVWVWCSWLQHSNAKITGPMGCLISGQNKLVDFKMPATLTNTRGTFS